MSGKKRAELLAPAGNAEGFYGALLAGADAVYLGGSRFGARAFAENFTTEQLVECIRYGHLFGRKIYLTVNTLLKESEMGELFDYLLPFYEAGLDAVIVQDMGVFCFIREHFPGLALHASTQMTLCSCHGAELLRQLGAVRIVPARELSLDELSQIKRQVDVELETFIHGAMCYCYSGQCLFSSILGGRSGNRGRCAQPCRLPYEVRAGGKQRGSCYPLSLKDMCTIEHIPQLTETGIDSFKIEGRMKRPEYTAGVTAIYRKYMDRYYELRERFGPEEAAKRYHISKKDLDDLSSLYIRSEKQDGYYFKHNGKEMITLLSPAYGGSDEELLSDIRDRYLEHRLKLPVAVDASFLTGLPAQVTLQAEDVSVTVHGGMVQMAQKHPITEENVRNQLGKMGESAFTPGGMKTTVGEDAFYPLKQMNELRREAIDKLRLAILEKNGNGTERRLSGGEPKVRRDLLLEFSQRALAAEKEPAAEIKMSETKSETTASGIVCSVRTYAQLKSAVNWIMSQNKDSLKRLYIDGDLLIKRIQEVTECCEKLRGRAELYIALPYILRQKDDIYLRDISEAMNPHSLFKGMLVRSLDELAYVKERGIPNRLDANVYSFNSTALEELGAMTEGFCLPLELREGEQRQLLEKGQRFSFEKIVYGRIVMMVTANCLLKTICECSPGNEDHMMLIDRYHKEFPAVRNCRHCYNIIYNSVPLSLHQSMKKWRGQADIRLDFTIESGEETSRILKAFAEQGEIPYNEYTTGHEKRGVE